MLSGLCVAIRTRSSYKDKFLLQLLIWPAKVLGRNTGRNISLRADTRDMNGCEMPNDCRQSTDACRLTVVGRVPTHANCIRSSTSLGCDRQHATRSCLSTFSKAVLGLYINNCAMRLALCSELDCRLTVGCIDIFMCLGAFSIRRSIADFD